MKWITLLFFGALTAQAQLSDPGWLGSLGIADPIIPPTTLLEESFEGTGYEVATTETSGTIDEDDTTSPGDGTAQNLKVPGGTYAYPTAGFTANSVITVEFAFKVDTIGMLNQVLQINATPNSTHRGGIQINGSDKLVIVGNSVGSVSAATADSVVAGTLYYCRARWNKTSGAYSVEFATTHSFLGSGGKYAAAADGDTGVTMAALNYDCTRVGFTAYLDEILVTTP